MPIESFISQPAPNSIHAAYRPIIIRVAATKTDATPRPPVVYCDIYFNDTFYKTISKSQYTKLNPTNTEWQFDIQDAPQEFLRKFIAANGGYNIVEGTLIAVKVLCKLRSSGEDANGFIQTEGIAPVQGTSDIDPIPGTGTSTNEFFVVNAVLQHTDNQDLSAHLSSYKKRDWAESTWPLSHRPDMYKIGVSDSDYFPILHGGTSLSCLVLHYMNKGQNTYHSVTNCSLNACPIVTGIQYGEVDNGDGTQTFIFTFDPISVIVAALTIEYRLSGSSNLWTASIGTIISPRSITLPLGLYDFRFKTSGACTPQYSPDIIGIGITGAVCTPAGFIGTPSLPDAMEDNAYSYTIYLTGTAPFSLGGVIKPGWMSIVITGSQIDITGTPGSGDVGEDINVSFNILNCTNDSLAFADTIDVAEVVGCVPASFTDGLPSLPDATANVQYSFNINLSGTAPFSLASVVKPSWMVIAVVGSQIQITGTPTEANVGNNILVEFEIVNCGVTQFGFSDMIDVEPDSGDRHKMIVNYTGFPGPIALGEPCVVDVTIYRTAGATTDATAAGERIKLSFTATSDNFCITPGFVIFEPTDTEKTTSVDLTCGSGMTCTSVQVDLTTAEVIP